MSRQNDLVNSDSVSEGHPDKVCDRISDAMLGAFLAEEAQARVARESFASTDRVVVGGEVGLSDPSRLADFIGRIDGIVRDRVRDIGSEQDAFHGHTLRLQNLLHARSAHIAQGMDRDGAGDQGRMFGYGVDATPELMPAPILHAQTILRRRAAARIYGAAPGPDAESQVTLRDADGLPVEVTQVVLSTQHTDAAQTGNDIRAHLALDRPIYARTASYGHFGRPPEEDGGFSWERTDLAAALTRDL